LARIKSGLGKQSSKEKPEQDSSPQWDSLAADLHRMGLPQDHADALVSWPLPSRTSRQSPVKIRVLASHEREFISVEAYITCSSCTAWD